MTISAFDIYLISLADDFSFFLLIVSVLSLFVVIFSFPAIDCCIDREAIHKIKQWQKRAAIIFITALSLVTVVPSSKTIAAMYLVPAIVNNKHLQNSAGNALEFLEELTKKWLKDTVKNNGSNPTEEHI